MLNIVRVANNDGDILQTFVCISNNRNGSIIFDQSQIMKNNNPSLVAAIHNEQYILKLVRPRKWQELFKLLWGYSRISKEINGNLLLATIGINVPKIVEHGLGLILTMKHHFLGYYIMENLTRRGMQNAASMLRSGQLTDIAKTHLFDNFLRDVGKIRERRIVFSDLKFNNIFSDKGGNIVWI